MPLFRYLSATIHSIEKPVQTRFIFSSLLYCIISVYYVSDNVHHSLILFYVYILHVQLSSSFSNVNQ